MCKSPSKARVLDEVGVGAHQTDKDSYSADVRYSGYFPVRRGCRLRFSWVFRCFYSLKFGVSGIIRGSDTAWGKNGFSIHVTIFGIHS